MDNKYKWISTLALLVIIVLYGAVNHQDALRRGPYKGMVYIPGGTFNMSATPQGISMMDFNQNSRQVTITPFYMDQTPITNEQYREFVHWVRDSIAVKNHGLADYLKIGPNGEEYIDWDKVNGRRSTLFSERNRSNDPNIQSAWDQFFYPDNPEFYMKREYNTNLFVYRYAWYDLRAAIAARNDETKTREDFIRRTAVNVYPDTTVWVADFSYAQNEPMVKAYFSHSSYNNYPVVGVNWNQAQAFNNWRTKKFEIEQAKRDENERIEINPFDLATEAEWQYAANGSQGDIAYPWGGASARNGGGQLLANFKPGRGNYIEDNYAYTSPVDSFFPNDFGLYDMAGNVAEWTSSSFDESASTFLHDLNPVYRYNSEETDAAYLKRKVIKGGSWKDTQDFLRNEKSAYEYQDSSRSYIGFRSISHALGAN